MFAERNPYTCTFCTAQAFIVAGRSQLSTITVRVLPPRESCSRRVSFESRYGIKDVFPSTSAEMTFPRADLFQKVLNSNVSATLLARFCEIVLHVATAHPKST